MLKNLHKSARRLSTPHHHCTAHHHCRPLGHLPCPPPHLAGSCRVPTLAHPPHTPVVPSCALSRPPIAPSCTHPLYSLTPPPHCPLSHITRSSAHPTHSHPHRSFVLTCPRKLDHPSSITADPTHLRLHAHSTQPNPFVHAHLAHSFALR